MAGSSPLGSRHPSVLSSRQRLYFGTVGQREAIGFKLGGHGEDKSWHGEKRKGRQARVEG